MTCIDVDGIEFPEYRQWTVDAHGSRQSQMPPLLRKRRDIFVSEFGQVSLM